MRLSDRIAAGGSLPRVTWTVDPRPHIVPARKGRRGYAKRAVRQATRALRRRPSQEDD
jgi:hypothetical protein